MPVDKQTEPANPASETPAAASRRLVRTSLKAALATLEDGHPYASLVLVATEPDGSPVLLVSGLAVHTRNLAKDTRATLLFDGTDSDADPLSGARVTLRGHIRRTDNPSALRRFLARHPSAEGYASFKDFATYAMDVSNAHFIGGFGRIVDIPRAELITPVANAEALLDAEPEILAHMNSDHADAVALYASRLVGASSAGWRMTGIDPDGLDLVRGSEGARVHFPRRIATPGDARKVLAELAAKARSGPPGGSPAGDARA